jgi:hypothetical protein
MYRYDYVLRLIERLGHVLRRLRDRLLQRQFSNHHLRAEVTEIAPEAGLDVAFARRLDPATLVAWLAPIPGHVDNDRVWLMAELLYAEALAARAAGQERQGGGDLRRAAVLFAHLDTPWKPSADLPSAGDRVAEIRALLPSLEPSADPDRS